MSLSAPAEGSGRRGCHTGDHWFVITVTALLDSPGPSTINRTGAHHDLIAASRPGRTGRDAARRGNHVAVEHPNAKAAVQALTARNIIFDFREPNIIRAGCSPLTTRFVDVYDGLAAIAALG